MSFYQCSTLPFPIEKNQCDQIGKNSPLWKTLKVFEQFLVCLIKYMANFLYILWQFDASGQILIALNGQRLKNNLVVWSHWQKLREILAWFSRAFSISPKKLYCISPWMLKLVSCQPWWSKNKFSFSILMFSEFGRSWICTVLSAACWRKLTQFFKFAIVFNHTDVLINRQPKPAYRDW